VVVSSIRNLRTHHAVITGDLLNIGWLIPNVQK
jgi:hypothetical protein